MCLCASYINNRYVSIKRIVHSIYVHHKNKQKQNPSYTILHSIMVHNVSVRTLRLACLFPYSLFFIFKIQKFIRAYPSIWMSLWFCLLRSFFSLKTFSFLLNLIIYVLAIFFLSSPKQLSFFEHISVLHIHHYLGHHFHLFDFTPALQKISQIFSHFIDWIHFFLTCSLLSQLLL